MATMNENELEKVLHKLLEEMHKKNLLPAGMDRNAVVKGVLDTFNKNGIKLDSNDFDFVRDPEKAHTMTKSLILALSTEATHLYQVEHPNPNYKPELKFKYENLFKFQPENIDQNEIKKELKNQLTMMNNMCKPKPGDKKLSDEDIEKIAENIAADFQDKFLKNDKDTTMLGQTKGPVDALSDVALSIGSLFGGIADTSVTGGVISPVEHILGNLAGWIDVTPGSGKSFMSDQNTNDANKVSKTGGTSTLTNIISKGSFISEVVQGLQKDHLLSPSNTMTPFATAPTPPGTK